LNKYFYSFDEFLKDLDTLEKEVKNINPHCLLCVSRGGMTIGHFLAERLNNKNLFSINASSYENETKISKPKIFNIPNLQNYKSVLIIDDISDSGETLEEIIKILKEKFPHIDIKSATIFYKKNTKLIPNIKLHKTDKWVVFFWDKEGQKRSKNE
jgi:xanthine phosphoribosyltransferase